jgi:hypothetical protein
MALPTAVVYDTHSNLLLQAGLNQYHSQKQWNHFHLFHVSSLLTPPHIPTGRDPIRTAPRAAYG